MNRFLKTTLLSVVLIVSFNKVVSQEMTNVLINKVDKSILTTYLIEQYTLVPIEVSEDINRITEADFSNNTLSLILKDNKKIGYAYIGQGSSMKDVFDYIILFDPDLIIVKAKVLIYRETYGTQIGSQRWLKQFIGKTSNDTLNYGKNIVAISGATISASSMSNEVNKVLLSLKLLIKKEML